MSITSRQAAFPKLDDGEMELVRSLAHVEEFASGRTIIKAGDPDIDFYVVESGAIDILNPTDGNRLIVSHEAGDFVGDIDLLTRRPVLICAVAKGVTRVLRVPDSGQSKNRRFILRAVQALWRRSIFCRRLPSPRRSL